MNKLELIENIGALISRLASSLYSLGLVLVYC